MIQKGGGFKSISPWSSCSDSKCSLFWSFRANLETLLGTLDKAHSSRMEMTRQLAILCTTTYRADMPSVTASMPPMYKRKVHVCMYVCMLVLF